ncbi:hypothetical protein SB48_HM08orf04350 [Heyndrickxia coagulans]|uniref:Uncharacterized protein n=1 Tax=Heyndrickxia coagulans TaxID=1398 RepID=A0AAN0T8F7_HEYCO|nr:hypothetical protein SB48_HM08orf04350 [Heyndrickxia coagulans]
MHHRKSAVPKKALLPGSSVPRILNQAHPAALWPKYLLQRRNQPVHS